ncbi:hypothetical protein D9611_009768 [Ephemerocybe angulata]|uniref:Uncharacterized protein n=1 Tax=Ephemerocybe angulata TaxID=980116 RepID=A0A8H5CCS3_9AGAR|nr:hypothetical protein D9611_009768 [Tulosesus angulatus]
MAAAPQSHKPKIGASGRAPIEVEGYDEELDAFGPQAPPQIYVGGFMAGYAVSPTSPRRPAFKWPTYEKKEPPQMVSG